MRTFRTTLGLVIVFALIVVPGAWGYHQHAHMRNFRVVRDGVLYRSGQMTLDGLKRVVHDYGIRTVVTLRDSSLSGQNTPDREEEKYCAAQDIYYVRIPPRNWEGPGSTAPADEGVQTFLAVMRDPANYPVLVHCFAGIHRTGAHCAVYRMEFEHWTNAAAIEEMKACGYSNLDEEWDILGYLEKYRPRWKEGD